MTKVATSKERVMHQLRVDKMTNQWFEFFDINMYAIWPTGLSLEWSLRSPIGRWNYWLTSYLDSLLITRISAPFSSRRRLLSSFS